MEIRGESYIHYPDRETSSAHDGAPQGTHWQISHTGGSLLCPNEAGVAILPPAGGRVGGTSTLTDGVAWWTLQRRGSAHTAARWARHLPPPRSPRIAVQARGLGR